MSCGRGPDCANVQRKCCPPGPGHNFFDMLEDTCARSRWNTVKAQIYAKDPCGNPSCGWCTPVSPCCRFPPKRCPPPPPPPRSWNYAHRCNPNRACGFIVKQSNYPGGRPQCCPCEDGCPCESCGPRGSGGCCSASGACCSSCPCVPANTCKRSIPTCCPIPDPCCPTCCPGSCSVYCRPPWRHNALKPSPYCLQPPPLPARSFRYKCWLSQFEGKLDSNLCPSRYSSAVDMSGCNMVIVDPPDCDACSPCPCHPCCDC